MCIVTVNSGGGGGDDDNNDEHQHRQQAIRDRAGKRVSEREEDNIAKESLKVQVKLYECREL
jgi:hypothetical protein